MSSLTINLSDTIESLYIRLENRPNQLSLDSRLHEFYWNNHKCLKIQLFIDQSYKIRNSNVSLLYLYQLDYMNILGKAEYRNIFTQKNWVMLFFHDSGSYVRGFELAPQVDVFHAGNNRRHYSYNKFEYVYLPPPYFSKCIDFQARKLESKEHCIESCMKQLFRKNIDPNFAIPPLTLTKEEWKSNPQLRFRGKSMPIILKYYDSCDSKCPFGCQTYFYEAELLLAASSPKGFEFGVRNIRVRRKLLFSPKLDTLSYIIFIASVCSLWMGFVIYDSFIALAALSLQKINMRNKSIKKALNHIAITNIGILSYKPTMGITMAKF